MRHLRERHGVIFLTVEIFGTLAKTTPILKQNKNIHIVRKSFYLKFIVIFENLNFWGTWQRPQQFRIKNRCLIIWATNLLTNFEKL